MPELMFSKYICYIQAKIELLNISAKSPIQVSL